MAAKQDWFLPIEQDNLTLNQALDQLRLVTGDKGGEYSTLMARLGQNPVLQGNGISCFGQPINNIQQACIHIMLGRGLLAVDEAFVIGFNLGCCNKVITSVQKLYSFASKNIYALLPELDTDARTILKDAIKLGYISNCTSLDSFDFTPWLDQSIGKVRHVLGIDPALLRAYFAVEKRRFPRSLASQRLLPYEPKMLVS